MLKEKKQRITKKTGFPTRSAHVICCDVMRALLVLCLFFSFLLKKKKEKSGGIMTVLGAECARAKLC